MGLPTLIGETAILAHGLIARYNRRPVLWRSKMQKTVALSSAETEYCLGIGDGHKYQLLRTLLANMWVDVNV